MSIETKTRLVVLWTIASVIALLFLTGCDLVTADYSIEVESTSGEYNYYLNDVYMGKHQAPGVIDLNTKSRDYVVIKALGGGCITATLFNRGEEVQTVKGPFVWFEIVIE